MNDSRSRSWMITQPAEGEHGLSEEELCERLSPYIWAGQVECGAEGGEGGYKHFQVLIQNPEPIRFTTLKHRLPVAHLEKRRGSISEALAYVTKEETRVASLPGNGTIIPSDGPGSRSDLEEMRQAILDGSTPNEVLLADPKSFRYGRHLRDLHEAAQAERWRTETRDVKAHYVWGATGVGKTRSILEKHGPENVYRATNYKHPFDNYQGQPVLALDEFYGGIEFNLLLNMLDPYPMQLPARYSNKWAAYETVYVVSNVPLSKQYTQVQFSNPEGYKALLRRFESVEEMKFTTAGTVSEEESPWGKMF